MQNKYNCLFDNDVNWLIFFFYWLIDFNGISVYVGLFYA